MSYEAKSLDELGQAARAAFRQYLPGTDATLAQNVLYVVAKVLALLMREAELRLATIYRQLFLSTATWESAIRLHAAEFNLSAKPASAASGVITGKAAPHQSYPAGARLMSGGITYVITGPFVAGALGDFSAEIAAERTGADTNRLAGATFDVVDKTLYPDFAEIVAGPDGIGGGAAMETLDELRRRALAVKASPPQGGALQDYERWAMEVPGVSNAYAAVYSNSIGHVGVWCLFGNRANGIATPADLDKVEAHVGGLRLVRGAFTATTPAAIAVDITVRLSPDTEATRRSVTAALNALFDARLPGSRIRPGLPGQPFALSKSWISEVISAAVGEDAHALAEPVGDLVFQPGEMPVLGVIDWT